MYPANHSQSRDLYQRALKSLPGGNTRTTVYMKPFPIYAASGAGCRVRDVDGNEYIDCINNFTSLIHGHAHPALIEAATKQLALGSAFGMPTESEVELAELLAARLPSVDHVRFCNSGTEAVMMALKAARAYTGRPKIAKCEGAYHGSYDYAEVSLDPTPAAWGGNAPVSVAYAKGTPDNVLADVVTIPFNDVEAAVSLIREHGPELACVLVDPMPNRAGLVPADRAYVEALRQVTREVGALLVFDEVITFRLGYEGAQGLWGIDPGGVRSMFRQTGAPARRHLLGQSRHHARRSCRHDVARCSSLFTPRSDRHCGTRRHQCGVPQDWRCRDRSRIGLAPQGSFHRPQRPGLSFGLLERGGSEAPGRFHRRVAQSRDFCRELWPDGAVVADDRC